MCHMIQSFHSSYLRVDRKSTRLNSSHDQISYAVFCLKKKKKKNNNIRRQLISSRMLSPQRDQELHAVLPNPTRLRKRCTTLTGNNEHIMIYVREKHKQ